MSKIKSTTNYSFFGYVGGNRDLDKGHLSRLEKSISKKNMLSANPILVNKNMEIIDGQHRLEAARKIGVPIYYIVLDGASLEEVVILNSNMKNWRLIDYIKSFSKLGRDDYTQLLSFIEYYSFPPSVAVHLLSGDKIGAGGPKGVKEGKFKVRSYDRAVEFADKYVRLRDKLGRFANTRDFIRALVSVLDNKEVSFDRLSKKFDLYGYKLKRRDSVNDYLRDLEEIYNYKQKGNLVRLF